MDNKILAKRIKKSYIIECAEFIPPAFICLFIMIILPLLNYMLSDVFYSYVSLNLGLVYLICSIFELAVITVLLISIINSSLNNSLPSDCILLNNDNVVIQNNDTISIHKKDIVSINFTKRKNVKKIYHLNHDVGSLLINYSSGEQKKSIAINNIYDIENVVSNLKDFIKSETIND